MAELKAHMLERFIGTDEGEVTEYLGCELVRDRKARTGQLIQAGYAERVLRVFNMWECNPVATPLDLNVRLCKLDCPEVLNPLVNRKYRSIVGYVSYLVNMTRTQNVADALTKSLPRHASHKHREFLHDIAQTFSAFFASAYEPVTKRGGLSLSKAPLKCIGG